MKSMSDDMTWNGQQGRELLDRRHQRGWRARLLALFAAIVFSLCLAEGIIRIFAPVDAYLPYYRNVVQVSYPNEEVTPGVSGVSYFSTNSLGLRGPEIGAERTRILTIGGSTTACCAVDDSEAWPQLLMDRLNLLADDPDCAWVGNSGMDGKNCEHHLMHVTYMLPRLPKIDFVLLYAGLNDLGSWVYQRAFDYEALKRESRWNVRVAEAFKVSPHVPESAPWYRHLRLWQVGAAAKAKLKSLLISKEMTADAIVQDPNFEWLREARLRRTKGAKSILHQAKKSDLPRALDYYDDLLRRIVTQIRACGSEPIFILQALEGHSLSASEQELYWMGAMDGGVSYLTEKSMMELIDAYNVRMALVAKDMGVSVIDLPTCLRGHQCLFYDSCHFNEHGCRVVADIVADYLAPLVLHER